MKAFKFATFLLLSTLVLALVAQSLAAAKGEWELAEENLLTLGDMEVKNALLSANVDNWFGWDMIFVIKWLDYRIYTNVLTTSHEYGHWIRFIPENMELSLGVVSESGANGKFYVCVPRNLIQDPEKIEVYLDNQPLQYTITGLENHYMLNSGEFTYSERVITIKLSPPFSNWYTQPLNLAIIAIAVVVALGAVYWLKFRR